ncbi:putative glycosidase C21B10.07 [Grifola frondosa]|uniref:Putative glycosidase C21B10.07 n=1 Tax=Grifola frondosa TaxID=5627 RepID=A0A1C7MB92_GRIFR|nr:putative glycosidase C21B10.07 [Grifola frondosa]
MYGALSALLLSLPLTVLAGVPHDVQFRRRHAGAAHNATIARRSSYTLSDHHAGQSFFDGFDFFSDADPTHGNVNYLSQAAATQAGLAYVQSDNTVVLKVDNTSTVPAGGNRNSVRITSKKTYNRGLFIADLFAMPHGCSVWPALWTVSATETWPDGGEVDIIENVNEATNNQITLHSGAGCTLAEGAKTLLSHVQGTTCASTGGNNAGCARAASSKQRRERQPRPVHVGNADGRVLKLQCDIASHFQNHQLVLDITLCGDWAGPAYSSSGQCPGTCSDAIADPSNFSVAKWMVNYIDIYQ